MTTFPATNRLWLHFERWVEKRAVLPGWRDWRQIFAAIWLAFDVLDMAYGQTKNLFFLYGLPMPPQLLLVLQGLLVAVEISLCLGFRVRYAALLGLAARGYLAFYYPTNESLYFCVCVAVFAAMGDGRGDEYRVWPRDVFVLQTAWIYLASAFWKVNPDFISGGDLYVRQNYFAQVAPWPFPAFYLDLISGLSGNQVLAWMAIGSEATLGLALLIWWLWPRQRRILRWLAVTLAICIHTYAAIALDVFFFGMSMVAQVMLLTL